MRLTLPKTAHPAIKSYIFSFRIKFINLTMLKFRTQFLDGIHENMTACTPLCLIVGEGHVALLKFFNPYSIL